MSAEGKKPTAALGGELADIILRTLDLAHTLGIDVDALCAEKMRLNKERGTQDRTF